MIKPARGDTIIEVMISIAIIGLALGTGFSLSSRSFHTGIGAVERSEALALAQGQIEFLKDAQLNPSPGVMGNIKALAITPGKSPFCIDTSNGSYQLSSTASCSGLNSGKYNIAITYDGNPASAQYHVFTIGAAWEAFGGGQSQLSLYYKVP